MTDFPLKRFSLPAVEDSAEIQSWLHQFGQQRAAAQDLILRLRFVPTDVYREWLQSMVLGLPYGKLAIYAVRKFDRNDKNALWDHEGESIKHEIKSLGSEDLVRSVAANLGKLDEKRFFDHPSLNELRRAQVNHIVLVEDSIGSGERTSRYINAMLSNPSFLSWWSYGIIRFHVIAFARNITAEQSIVERMAGSNHPRRRYPKSRKIKFYSHRIYKTKNLRERWGSQFQNIIDLCDSINAVPKGRKFGFRGTMSNILFYHSVPNNIPGVLWSEGKDWQPLFPARVLPNWARRLLDSDPSFKNKIPNSLVNLLLQIKRGVRTKSSLSHELGFDITVVDELLSSAHAAGFLTESGRLTNMGAQVVWEARNTVSQPKYDRSIFIPTKWWVDRGTVQPCD